MRTYPEEAAIESILRRIEVDERTGCWVWTRSTLTGYAFAALGDWTYDYVHRWVYEHYVDSIPKGWEVHHRCGNKACINPDHLEALTRKEHKARHRS